MLLDKDADVAKVFEAGVYSTYVSDPVSSAGGVRWGQHHEATLADFLTMREGDYIFFFQDRRIFGAGKLVRVGEACAYQVFPGASHPETATPKDSSTVLWYPDNKASLKHHRWLCCFTPAPSLLKTPVDMDDALNSHPTAFRSLRVIQKRSFIKMDDAETDALLDVLARRNDSVPDRIPEGEGPPSGHARIRRLAARQHALTASEVLAACSSENGSVSHEMAIEAGLLHDLNAASRRAAEIFGSWDYLSHQVHASPFKPVDYMDKIDVFGYRRQRPFNSIGRYLVAELKKDEAGEDDVRQLLKYVDWVAQTYCSGDYSMIEAFLVARGFTDGAVDAAEAEAVRWYTVWSRPVVSRRWRHWKLVTYEYNAEEQVLNYQLEHAGRQ